MRWRDGVAMDFFWCCCWAHWGNKSQWQSTELTDYLNKYKSEGKFLHKLSSCTGCFSTGKLQAAFANTLDTTRNVVRVVELVKESDEVKLFI